MVKVATAHPSVNISELPKLEVEIVDASGEVEGVMQVDDPRTMWCEHFNEIWAKLGRTARPKISA